MRIIWYWIDRFGICTSSKNRLFIAVCAVLFALSGAFVWMAVGRFFLPSSGWLFCFAGYPAVFAGVIGGAFYLFNHEFERCADREIETKQRL